MCFKNLPIEFDAQGRATLLEGVRDPYAYETHSLADQEDKIKDLLARNGHIKSVDFDPVTRVAGARQRRRPEGAARPRGELDGHPLSRL